MPLRLIAALLVVVLCWTGLATQERFGIGAGGPSVSAAGPLGGESVGSVGHHHLDDQSGATADVPDAVIAPRVLPVPLPGGERHASERLPEPESADLRLHPPPPRGLCILV
jgi:hypothetical protein